MNKTVFLVIFFFLSTKNIYSSSKFLDIPSLEEDKIKTYSFSKINFNEIKFVNFSKCNLTDQKFSLFTESLSDKFSKNLELIDLSHTQISENIAKDLNKWFSEGKKPFIYLIGSPISVRNIQKLSDKLVEVQGDKKHFYKVMKKIIFITSDYLRKANNVQVYKKLERQKKISKDWWKIHKDFYNLETVKQYLHHKKFSNYQVFIENIPTNSTADNFQKSEELSDQSKEELTFEAAFKALTFKD